MKDKIKGFPETFDTLKTVFGKHLINKDIISIEHNYVINNPDCSYETVIRKTAAFPDYLDYFPKGAIQRKLPIMAYEVNQRLMSDYIFISEEEYETFVEKTVDRIYNLLLNLNAIL